MAERLDQWMNRVQAEIDETCEEQPPVAGWVRNTPSLLKEAKARNVDPIVVCMERQREFYNMPVEGHA